ncbi:MAG: YcaO-like family protein [Clostridia bacterium]|nr:YcaO-like family protein [Clostridia bacterium]
MKTINQLLFEQSCNFRCGISLPIRKVNTNFCDIPDIYNYSVPEDSIETWRTASGSISFDENKAIMGAIGEALERYSGAICKFELKKISDLKGKTVIPYTEFALFSNEQYNNPDFKWNRPNPEDQYYGKVFSLYDNREVYVPQELIGLGSRVDTVTIPSTSTGIAAHTSINKALLSAIQEILERDALTVYWMNSLGGREIPLSEKYLKEVRQKKGKVYCFDITQDWNPFAVVMVCGYLLKENQKIISMGVACRENYEQAIEKAYLEWIQGCTFARYFDEYNDEIEIEDNSDIVDFDLHAVYYTKYPDKWNDVPLIKNKVNYKYTERNQDLKNKSTEEKIEFLLEKLKKENIRLYYKNLTSVDVKDIGAYVVRVISPELSLIHGDENAPFLGGRTNDVKWRYKDLKEGIFPNPFPHPLG